MTQQDFIGSPENWDNHRVLLWLALEATAGGVLEFGMGDGSTRQLHQYCKDSNRLLWSFDNTEPWVSKFIDLRSPKHLLECCGEDWDSVIRKLQPHEWDVALIDHAPGERRKVDIALLSQKVKILVIHDAEPHEGYGLDVVWPMFGQRVNVKTPGAWASAVSNFVNLQPWIGAQWGKYTVTT